MILEGWSNIKNEPIICCSISNDSGHNILVETTDSSENAHTGDYLLLLRPSTIVRKNLN